MRSTPCSPLDTNGATQKKGVFWQGRRFMSITLYLLRRFLLRTRLSGALQHSTRGHRGAGVHGEQGGAGPGLREPRHGLRSCRGQAASGLTGSGWPHARAACRAAGPRLSARGERRALHAGPHQARPGHPRSQSTRGLHAQQGQRGLGPRLGPAVGDASPGTQAAHSGAAVPLWPMHKGPLPLKTSHLPALRSSRKESHVLQHIHRMSDAASPSYRNRSEGPGQHFRAATFFYLKT